MILNNINTDHKGDHQKWKFFFKQLSKLLLIPHLIIKRLRIIFAAPKVNFKIRTN